MRVTLRDRSSPRETNRACSCRGNRACRTRREYREPRSHAGAPARPSAAGGPLSTVVAPRTPTRPAGRRPGPRPRRPALDGGLALLGLALAAVVLPLPLTRAPELTLAAVVGLVGLVAVVLRLEAAFLLLVAVAPFERYVTMFGGAFAVKGVGLLVFVAWAVRALGNGSSGLRRHPALAAAGGLALAVLFSAMVQLNGGAGMLTVVRYLSFLGTFVVAVSLLRDRTAAWRTAAVFVLACCGSSASALSAFFSGSGARAGGPLEDPNDLAYFLASAIPLALALASRARAAGRRGVALGWVGAAVLLATGIAGTLSRGALLGLVALLVWAVGQRLVRPRLVVAGAVALGVVLGGIALAVPDLVATALHQKTVVATTNIDTRASRWIAATEMFFDHPLTGVGPSGFGVQYLTYAPNAFLDDVGVATVVHDMYLDVASELGAPGLIAFLPGRLRLPGGPAAGAPGAGPGRRPAWLATRGSLIVILTASAFLTEQYYLPLWMMLAFGVALELGPADPARPARGGRRVRVAQLLTQTAGGPVDHAVDLAVELARRGYDSLLLMPPGPVADAASARGVRSSRVEVTGSRDVAGPARSTGPCAGCDRTCCTAQDRRSGLVGRLLGRRRGRPHRLHPARGARTGSRTLVRGNLAIEPERRTDRLAYLRGERALAAVGGGPVVSPSDALVEYLTRWVGVPASRVHRVHNGVDTGHYDQAPLPAQQPGRLTVAWVGGLVPCKRLDALLDAAAAVPGVELLLAGDGELGPDLRARATALGLDGRVQWLGRVPDAAPVLARAHAFALTSAAENLPLALLQAMSTGRAAVATTVGGIGEVVTPGADGLLVPPGDVAALAAALERLRDDPALTTALGAAARRTVLTRFSTPVMVDALLDVYDGARR